jgi:halimadienyl-diphosphate synthase
MNLTEEFRNLLQIVGTSVVSTSPYDTAWVARLGAAEEQLAEEALQWLLEHQLPDGGWGDGETLYGHDRFICTLAAIVALAENGYGDSRLQRAQEALEIYIYKLRADPAGATVGFEMILPTLLNEAETLGIISAPDDPLLEGMAYARAAKLKSLSGHKINRFVTPAFSAEMVGSDGLHLLDQSNLQEANGSIAYSPSATAFFVMHVRHQDSAALNYLRSIANPDGGVPYVGPIDVFEHAWALRDLALVGLDNLDKELLTLCQSSLDFLESNWEPGKGIAACAGLTLLDGDDTGVTFEALTRFGRSVDVEGVLNYEDDEHFRCYPLEANPAISANIHALSALRAAGCDERYPAVQKLIGFLWRTRTGRLIWFDKWHSSPYYPTGHAVVSLAGCHDEIAKEMVADAIYWILQTQNLDGSWGFYGRPTAEETSYALQALVAWKRSGDSLPAGVIKRAKTWLRNHIEPPYPPLWIGKSLYCPTLVVRSSILASLMLTEQEEV